MNRYSKMKLDEMMLEDRYGAPRGEKVYEARPAPKISGSYRRGATPEIHKAITSLLDIRSTIWRMTINNDNKALSSAVTGLDNVVEDLFIAKM